MIEHLAEEPVHTIRINRPDKANSVTRDMLVEIEAHAAHAEEAGAAALVLTGTGKIFSAGADLDEAKAGLAKDPVWEAVSSRIANLPCLTIAALNGTLAGGAFGMALACDLRIAVPTAKFFYPVMKMGFLPQPSDPDRLKALIGPARTAMILLASQKIDAETALRWGLIDRIIAHENMEATVADLTEAVCNAAPGTRTGIKAMIG